MDPPKLPTFEEVDRQIRAAVKRALEVTAQRSGLAADLELLDRILDHPASTDDEVRQYFKASPPLALVDFDTPGIQDYVFSSQRPVDLAGGSALIGDLTRDGEDCKTSIFRHFRKGRVHLPPEAVIYGGGGGGLLLVAAVEAEQVCRGIERILNSKTDGALKSVASFLTLWPIELSPGSASIPQALGRVIGPQRAVSRYSASIIALEAKLGRRRSQSLELSQVIDSKNDHQRCHVCSERSASTERPQPGEEGEKLCSSCYARWDYGKEDKRGGKEEEEQPWSFDKMFEDLPRRDLAVIYADGANVGQAFQLIDSPQRHRALSLAVDDAMERMVDAARVVCKELTGIDKNLVLSPVLGGDDVVLVLPGMVAQQVVGRMIEVFEGAFDLEGNALLREAFGEDADEIAQHLRRFGLGVGLAVGRGNFPVHFLLDYARQLLKSAKGEIRRQDSKIRSAVDFMILSSGAPVSHDVEEVRTGYLHRQAKHGESVLRFTRRPYAASEFAALVHKTELLERHVDRSQVHLMRQEVWRGHALSRNLWRYQHARAKDDQGWAAFRRASKCGLGAVDSLLWQAEGSAGAEPSADGVMSTDYLDACELLSLRGANVPSEDLNPLEEADQ